MYVYVYCIPKSGLKQNNAVSFGITKFWPNNKTTPLAVVVKKSLEVAQTMVWHRGPH